MSDEPLPEEPLPADPAPAQPAAGGVIDYQQPMTSTARRWTTVWKGGTNMEANLLVTKLQAAGMHARVDMENTGTLGLGAGMIYGTKVQVLGQDEADARSLIADIEATRARRVEAQSLRCPRCNAGNPKRRLHPLRWLGMATLAAFVALVGMWESIAEHVPPGWILLLLPAGIAMLVWGVTPRWLCRSCGTRWAAKEPEAVDDEEEDDEDEDDDDGEETKREATSSPSSPPSR